MLMTVMWRRMLPLRGLLRTGLVGQAQFRSRLFHSGPQLGRVITKYQLQGSKSLACSSVLPLWKSYCRVPNDEALDAIVGEHQSPTCSGCGASFQIADSSKPGYIPKPKFIELQKELELCDGQHLEEAENRNTSSAVTEKSLVVCNRCFSLKHYNTALDITLKRDDYLHHLSHLKDKRALILLIVDVTDFPGSLFPDLNTLIPPTNPVVIVANKTDLLPKGLQAQFWKEFESMITTECLKSILVGCNISEVHFVSAKTGRGTEELTEAILGKWGNRGDVYLLGCTNVGKSTLFNSLLVTLCGARPGDLTAESNIGITPAATISQWPGTTLGLLSFPIMSMGKRRRRFAQARRRELAGSAEEVDIDAVFDEEVITKKKARQLSKNQDILDEIGLHRKPSEPKEHEHPPPQNRFWLHDTPGAINDEQLINLLTTTELKLALPKKSLKPRTFILRCGESLFIGGLARMDYVQGPVSAYFTVFANSYLPVHTTKISKADEVYANNVGTHLLKIPCGNKERLARFPKLEAQDLSITGAGWKQSAADVVLSSVGWVAVTAGEGQVVALRAYTPLGKGIVCRRPSLIPTAVNERGKRSQKRRTTFTGKRKKL